MCMEHAQFARVMSHAAPPPAPRDNGPDPAPAASACPGGTYASEPRVGTRPPYVDHADAGWRVGGINEPPLARGEFHDRVSPASRQSRGVRSHDSRFVHGPARSGLEIGSWSPAPFRYGRRNKRNDVKLI